MRTNTRTNTRVSLRGKLETILVESEKISFEDGNEIKCTRSIFKGIKGNIRVKNSKYNDGDYKVVSSSARKLKLEPNTVVDESAGNLIQILQA